MASWLNPDLNTKVVFAIIPNYSMSHLGTSLMTFNHLFLKLS